MKWLTAMLYCYTANKWVLKKGGAEIYLNFIQFAAAPRSISLTRKINKQKEKQYVKVRDIFSLCIKPNLKLSNIGSNLQKCGHLAFFSLTTTISYLMDLSSQSHVFISYTVAIIFVLKNITGHWSYFTLLLYILHIFITYVTDHWSYSLFLIQFRVRMDQHLRTLVLKARRELLQCNWYIQENTKAVDEEIAPSVRKKNTRQKNLTLQ